MSSPTIADHDSPREWRASLTACCAVLNFDFCPWANRWVYWLKQPLWCLVSALAVSIICGVLVNSQLWLISGALALVLAMGIGWPWLTIRGVTCALEFERTRTRVGQPVTIRLRMTNRWPWPVWGVALERGFGKANDHSAGIALARLPGWWRGEFEWTFAPTCRGVLPLQPPAIVTGFPFGVWSASKPVSVANELIVWPRTVSLRLCTCGTRPLYERNLFACQILICPRSRCRAGRARRCGRRRMPVNPASGCAFATNSPVGN